MIKTLAETGNQPIGKTPVIKTPNRYSKKAHKNFHSSKSPKPYSKKSSKDDEGGSDVVFYIIVIGIIMVASGKSKKKK